jgi:uncharacterized protein YbbK (DUF523 family)
MGINVRYDGSHKKHTKVAKLCNIFECIAICPETNIGLGVPRAPLKMVKVNNSFHIRGRTNPNLDVTYSLQKFAKQVPHIHQDICGYVFKARSPSCGVGNTPWFDESGKEMGIANGIFSEQIKKTLPHLPIIEETQLEDPEGLDNFVAQVKSYSEL